MKIDGTVHRILMKNYFIRNMFSLISQERLHGFSKGHIAVLGILMKNHFIRNMFSLISQERLHGFSKGQHHSVGLDLDTWNLMKKYQNWKTTLQFSDISEYYVPTAPMVGSNKAGPYPVPTLIMLVKQWIIRSTLLEFSVTFVKPLIVCPKTLFWWSYVNLASMATYLIGLNHI